MGTSAAVSGAVVDMTAGQTLTSGTMAGDWNARAGSGHAKGGSVNLVAGGGAGPAGSVNIVSGAATATSSGRIVIRTGNTSPVGTALVCKTGVLWLCVHVHILVYLGGMGRRIGIPDAVNGLNCSCRIWFGGDRHCSGDDKRVH